MGTIAPITIRLKDGTSIGLRTPGEDDAAAALAYARLNIEDGVGSVSTPEEFTLTVDEEREFLADHLAHPDDLVIIAEHEGALVGFVNFKASRRKRLAHHGSFGISVHPDWRDRGIGRALLETLLAWARANPRLTKVSLAVIADNDRAIALYRKLGFIEEGRRINHIRYDDGRYADDLLMYVLV
ncbi:MAG: GNAT family N-acetyltransferase [Planctomycetes bacterium]|nr:GNAT family N-acetyltransferase [Planctomycetota bacterium]